MDARSVFVILLLCLLKSPSAWAEPERSEAQRLKLHGVVRFPDTPGRALETYCNIHGPTVHSAEYKIIDAEANADPALKQRWITWSRLIVDELRRNWSEIASVEGDCDVVSIKISNRHIEFGPDDCFPHNQLIVPEVDACLRTLEGSALLDLPRGTSVKRVMIFASFAAGRGATKFDWKPELPGAQLFGYECPVGATSHESIGLSAPTGRQRSASRNSLIPLMNPIFPQLLRLRPMEFQ